MTRFVSLAAFLVCCIIGQDACFAGFQISIDKIAQEFTFSGSDSGFVSRFDPVDGPTDYYEATWTANLRPSDNNSFDPSEATFESIFSIVSLPPLFEAVVNELLVVDDFTTGRDIVAFRFGFMAQDGPRQYEIALTADETLRSYSHLTPALKVNFPELANNIDFVPITNGFDWDSIEVQSSIAPIPEPSTIILFSTAILSTILVRRRSQL